MPITITSPDDERVADYFKLTDVALRKKLETERGLYIAESEKVIRRALARGDEPRSLLMGERWLDDLADVVADAESAGVPVYVGEAHVIESMTGFHLHRGALASMNRPRLRSTDELLREASRIVVLEDIVDRTNVGAIFRSAAALGVDAVLVTPRCADPLYRRAVRVSMGTVFQVPWTRVEPWPAGMRALQHQGWTFAAMALSDESLTLDALAERTPEKLALVMGTEGDGLSSRTVAACDLTVRIPMAAGVDSLNVAAASAVAMYTLRQTGERH